MNKKGFTLAEVLITLGVIGVVSAITTPLLISKFQTQETVSKLRAIQSILSQAVMMAETEYGSTDSWGITGNDKESSKIIAKHLKPFLKIVKDCGIISENSDCQVDNEHLYYYLSSKTSSGSSPNTFLTSEYDAYAFILSNGILIAFSGRNDYRSISFTVDINGKERKPNIIGIDTFQFYYDKGAIIPSGAKGYNDYQTCCFGNAPSGWGCAYYVLETGKMDYK